MRELLPALWVMELFTGDTLLEIQPFAVRWQIKHFHCFLLTGKPYYVESPQFTAYVPSKTKWCLKLYFEESERGCPNVKICLKSKNISEIRISYQLDLRLPSKYFKPRYSMHTFRPNEEQGTHFSQLAFQTEYIQLSNICHVFCVLGLFPYRSQVRLDNALLNDIGSMYRQPDLSDLILKFDGEEFPIHLALLRVRAPKLANYFKGNFSPKQFEYFLRSMHVTKRGFDLFLRFIYCGLSTKIMAEKCSRFETINDEDREANILDLVCDSCGGELLQVYRMSAIFRVPLLSDELLPPFRNHCIQTAFNCHHSEEFRFKIGNFWELITNQLPQVCRKLRVQHLRLELALEMRRSKGNIKALHFVFRLLPPETETLVIYDISIAGSNGDKHHIKGSISFRPNKGTVSVPTFLTKSFLEKHKNSFLQLNTMQLKIKLCIPHCSTKQMVENDKRFNEASRIYNCISFQESILGLSPTADDRVVFLVGNKTFEASKFVLAARSPVFRRMFATPMREGITGVVKMSHINYKTFDCFMQYLRFGRLPKTSNRKCNNIDLWFDLFLVSHMYLVESLVAKCVTVLKFTLGSTKAKEKRSVTNLLALLDRLD